MAATATSKLPQEEQTTGNLQHKTVLDEVSGWLRLYDDGTVDRTWTGPPEVQFLATPYHPSPQVAAEDAIVLRDVTLAAPSNLSLRIYSPLTTHHGHPLPVLLHFQGGGFCISRPTWYMYYQFYSRLCASLPAVIISVTARLAPEHRLPAAIEDCYSALLWLRSLARHPTSSELPNADLSRVFLIGDSSGGNLVHEVARKAGMEEEGFWSPVKLAGAIPIHPGFVRSSRSSSELEGTQDPFLTLDMLDKFLALSLPVGATKDHPYTCPMGMGGLEELRMPPMLVGVAEMDLIRDTEMEYCEAMRKAGKDLQVFLSREVGHSFYLNGIAVKMDPTVGRATAELVEAIGGFVRSH